MSYSFSSTIHNFSAKSRFRVYAIQVLLKQAFCPNSDVTVRVLNDDALRIGASVNRWREATIISHLDPDHWRAGYPGGSSGMFREADIRAYDPKRDAMPAKQPRRAKPTTPQKSSRSRYTIDPEAIAAGQLPDTTPVVTSNANPHYQKHFDRLFALAKAGDWDGVGNYEVKGSNSYSKLDARYQRDLLALHAASESPAW
jgi:hypothetical protein